MMVVPIHHKWQASKVRLQIVTKHSIVQVLAFMEDFSHADAMCFQVKSTDTFESVKGDSKGKKWAVKMKDAKFSLPAQEKGEAEGEDLVRRRFVNQEGLDYAEEHDDITIGFDTEEGERQSTIHSLLQQTLLTCHSRSRQVRLGSPCRHDQADDYAQATHLDDSNYTLAFTHHDLEIRTLSA